MRKAILTSALFLMILINYLLPIAENGMVVLITIDILFVAVIYWLLRPKRQQGDSFEAYLRSLTDRPDRINNG